MFLDCLFRERSDGGGSRKGVAVALKRLLNRRDALDTARTDLGAGLQPVHGLLLRIAIVAETRETDLATLVGHARQTDDLVAAARFAKLVEAPDAEAGFA